MTNHTPDINGTVFRCPSWNSDQKQKSHTSSNPISPLTIAYHTVRVLQNGSVSNVNTLAEDPVAIAPEVTNDNLPPAPTEIHKGRISSIRWLLSSPDGVQSMSNAFIAPEANDEPVLHLQHRMSISSMNAEPLQASKFDQKAQIRGSLKDSDDSTSVEPRSEETSQIHSDHEGSQDTHTTGPISPDSPGQQNLLLSPGQKFCPEPQTISAMDLISQIHDICIRATRTYLLSQMVFAYMRDPLTTNPYSHRRSLSPSRLPLTASPSTIREHHRPDSRHDQYRQREPTTSSHSRSSTSGRSNVSWNLSTNVSLMCTLAWTHAGRARLSDASVERTAVFNMGALLEWGDKIVGAEQEIWDRRQDMDQELVKRLERIPTGDMTVVRNFRHHIREMEWNVVLGVASAAVNICLYMDNHQAKSAIKTLLMG